MLISQVVYSGPKSLLKKKEAGFLVCLRRLDGEAHAARVALALEPIRYHRRSGHRNTSR